mmetsp:Transcript_1895/g.5216  ORF Transcript_1895/g.5216 Transcript_1895/m.5216 type:complete len:217 (-) Transcript_1895:554-1204(-)
MVVQAHCRLMPPPGIVRCVLVCWCRRRRIHQALGVHQDLWPLVIDQHCLTARLPLPCGTVVSCRCRVARIHLLSTRCSFSWRRQLLENRPGHLFRCVDDERRRDDRQRRQQGLQRTGQRLQGRRGPLLNDLIHERLLRRGWGGHGALICRRLSYLTRRCGALWQVGVELDIEWRVSCGRTILEKSSCAQCAIEPAHARTKSLTTRWLPGDGVEPSE